MSTNHGWKLPSNCTNSPAGVVRVPDVGATIAGLRGGRWRYQRGRSAASTTKRAVATSCARASREGWRSGPSKGSCTFAMAFEIEPRDLRDGLARRPGLHRAGLHAGGDGARATGRSGSSPTREQAPSSARRSRLSPAVPRAVPWRHCRDSSERFWACSQHQFASIGAARSGPSRRQISSTWLPKARRDINPDATEPMHLDNTGHPAADRFALARAANSRVHALGLAWEDVSGKNNGQYAPFSWRNA